MGQKDLTEKNLEFYPDVFADIFNALMAIPNLLCLIFLSNVIVEETRKYLWNDNLNQEEKRV